MCDCFFSLSLSFSLFSLLSLILPRLPHLLFHLPHPRLLALILLSRAGHCLVSSILLLFCVCLTTCMGVGLGRFALFLEKTQIRCFTWTRNVMQVGQRWNSPRVVVAVNDSSVRHRATGDDLPCSALCLQQCPSCTPCRVCKAPQRAIFSD